MTDAEQDAVYSAYLTIGILKKRCLRNGLTEEAEFASSAMVTLGETFAFIPIRVGRSAMRRET